MAEADEEGMDEDAFEKLFSLLEEDLKNDGLSGDDFDDEISEEELEKLERELAAALAEDDYEDDDEDADEDEDTDEEIAPSKAQSADDDFSDDDSEEEDDITLPKLKNWQLRRLASALKIGRRKTNVRMLAIIVILIILSSICIDNAPWSPDQSAFRRAWTREGRRPRVPARTTPESSSHGCDFAG